MFAYNTRTEIVNGAKFIEPDIILLDYVYTDDILFHVDAILKMPGFGFIIKEYDDQEFQAADNVVLISFSNDNSYRVILKNGVDQATVVNQFIDSPTDLYEENGTTLFFKKHHETLSVCKAIRQDNGSYQEIPLMSYKMANDMNRYRIGIYSNAGNTVRTAVVKTMAPNNWVSNVFNACGGRIIWIKNGFTIDESEYDIEAESIEIPMKAGTYWFDYQTDNPDMKAYIYEATRKYTDTKRLRSDILDTMKDEDKNIVEENGRFVLPHDCTINVKFKGKWGTVTDICIKDNREDPFIATGYGVTVRPSSYIVFELDKIIGFHIKGTILSVPVQDAGEQRRHQLFQSGDQKIGIQDPVMLQKKHIYDFSIDDRTILVDGQPFFTVPEDEDILTAFHNMTAIITEFTVTQTDGTTFSVLLQKTIKTTVSRDITSPILVIDENNQPLDLSSSYRQVAETKQVSELFNAYNGIYLSYYPDITNPNIAVYGIPMHATVLNRNAVNIDEIADTHQRIDYALNISDILQKQIRIPYTIRKQYKYIVVMYRAITGYRYEFTNWERELFDLKKSTRLYLQNTPLNTVDGIVVYGIKEDASFNENLLSYIPDKRMENSIAMATDSYDIITGSGTEYAVNATNRLVLDANILQTYRYIVVDYLKQDSYSINEREDYYEIDIAMAGNKVNILYDSKDGNVTEEYRVLNFAKMTRDTIGYEVENNDLIVLGDKPDENLS